MATTLAPPRAAAPPPDAARHGTHDARPTPRFHIPAEAALAALTLATVFGFSRVFDSGAFWGPLFLITAYTHIVLIALRRKGVGILLSAVIGLAGLVVTITYTLFGSSLSYGLPSGRTIDAVRDALAQSWQTFQSVQPPAPVENGFLMAAGVAIFFAVFLADWAAFRLWSSWEAIVPATTVFIFCSVLGGTEHRLESVGAFAGGAMAFLLLHRIARRETSAGWLASDARRGANSWLRVGAALGSLGVLAGVIVAPKLPGADKGALIGRDNKPGKGDRFTVSPLVEIKSRMTEQENVEMFTVKAGKEGYWRLTALDLFDGQTWRSRGKFVEAEGDLKPVLGAAKREPLTQEYTISSLARLWLPAAYQVQRVSESANARYHDESGTLIVDTDVDTSDGLTYTVDSLLPQLDPEELSKADPKLVDATLRAHYTELPSGWSTQAPSKAQEIVTLARADNDYDRARALQDFFQDPKNGFRYNLAAQPGQSGNAIDNFLKSKEGYCEQYSAAFAAMARSLGIPARVAVGFTWGVRDASDPSLFHVKGEHAHAWPEVYLGQYGWVSFEPTPSRGQPGAEAWTGLQASQEPESTEPSGSTVTTKRPTVGTSIVPGTATTIDPSLDVVIESPTTTIPLGDQSGEVSGAGQVAIDLAVKSIVIVLIAGLLIAVYAAIVASWITRQRRHRRALAQTPADLVRLAWADAVDHLSMIGAMPERFETHSEFAARASRLLPASEAAIMALALDADAAIFGEHLLTDETAAMSDAAANAVRLAVDVQVPPLRQWLTRLNPSWVFRRTQLPDTHRATSSHIGTAGATG